MSKTCWNQLYSSSLKLDININQNIEKLLELHKPYKEKLDSSSIKLIDEILQSGKFENVNVSAASREVLINIINIMKTEKEHILNLLKIVNNDRKCLRVNNFKLMERLYIFENFNINKFDNDFAVFCNRTFNLHYELLKFMIKKEQQNSQNLEDALIKKDEELKRAREKILQLEKTLIEYKETIKKNVLGSMYEKETVGRSIVDPQAKDRLLINDSVTSISTSRFKDRSMIRNHSDFTSKSASRFIDSFMVPNPKDGEAFDVDIINSINSKWQRKLMEIKEKQKNTSGSIENNALISKDYLENKYYDAKNSNYTNMQESPIKYTNYSEGIPQILLTSPDSATTISYISKNLTMNTSVNSTASTFNPNINVCPQDDKIYDSEKLKHVKNQNINSKSNAMPQTNLEMTNDLANKKPIVFKAPSTKNINTSKSKPRLNLPIASPPVSEPGRKTFGIPGNKNPLQKKLGKTPSTTTLDCNETKSLRTLKHEVNGKNLVNTSQITPLNNSFDQDLSSMSMCNLGSSTRKDFETDMKPLNLKRESTPQNFIRQERDRNRVDNPNLKGQARSLAGSLTPQTNRERSSIKINPIINIEPVVVKKTRS